MKPEPLTADQLIERLHGMANTDNVAGMARFGINSTNTLGVSMPQLRALARGRRSQPLSLELWESGIHEARILAALVGDPAQVSREQMDAWVNEFDSWDVCDQVCLNLFDRTPFAWEKAVDWAGKEPEFVKRAGFALMACLAWHDKTAPDTKYLEFLPIIERESVDRRNFVKKAVNWALRQIGKRSPGLNQAAVLTARQIRTIDSAAARWIASDALKELENLPQGKYKK